jgi:hypothetical protein
MASTATTQILFARNVFEMFFHNPGSVSPTVVSSGWRDMEFYKSFAVQAMNAVLTGNGITLLDIVAGDDSSGTNLVVVTSKAMSPSVPTVGDYIGLEIVTEQIREVSAAAGFNSRYVAARLTLQNSADKAAVFYCRSRPLHETLNLTTDLVH